MTKEEMLDFLDGVEKHISENNSEDSQQLPDLLFKIKFLKSMVFSGEIENLTQLVSYAIYVGPVDLKEH